MTPDQAMNHEWLAHRSDSRRMLTSQVSTPSPVTVKDNSGKRYQSQDESDPNQYAIYKLYKNRKPVGKESMSSQLVSDVGSAPCNSVFSPKHNSSSRTCKADKGSSSSSAASTDPQPSSSDPCLDDSGTFLPPIL